MIGFNRPTHSLGTVTGNYTLSLIDTGVNVTGDSTINLPATPSTNQIIAINNTGTGTVTVSGNGNNIGSSATTTITAGTSKWFAWGGYTWGFVFGGSCETVTLPVTKDFGVVQYAGPAETAYGVPQTTVEYESIGYTPCGGLLRKVITTTYAGREVTNQWKAIATLTNIGVNEEDGSYGGSSAWVPTGNTLIAYGESALIAYTAANYAFWLINPVNGWSNGVSRGVKPGFIDTNGVMYSGASNLWSNNTFLQLTLYYLDSQIVWTYEII